MKKRNCLVIQRNSFSVKGLSISNLFKFDDGLFTLYRINYLKNIEVQ
jgi:hypothetical protein